MAESGSFADSELRLKYETGMVEDVIKFTVMQFDVDINTDDHPRQLGVQLGVPVVSVAGNIDASDDSAESSLGGYLWVNDDNDHVVANDAMIDLEVTTPSLYNDNDLEPVLLRVSTGLQSLGAQLHVSVSDASVVRVWKGGGVNKGALIAPGDYGPGSVLDQATTQTLYLEGLRSGTCTVDVELRFAGGNAIMSDQIKATVFGVEKIMWVDNLTASGSTYIDNTSVPNPTGQTRTGKRIFPDKQTETDTDVHDCPAVITQLTPHIPSGSGWNVPVVCKAFDVDHYSSGTIEGWDFDVPSSSYNTENHTTGTEPNDNRTGYSASYDQEGRFDQAGDGPDFGLVIDTSTAPDYHDVVYLGNETSMAAGGYQNGLAWYERISEASNNQGKAVLHITHHTPCNNWRVAASCAGGRPMYAIRINDDPGDGQTLEYINNTPLTTGTSPNIATKCTEILTVWRYLYIEKDYMEHPVDYDMFRSESTTDHRSIQFGEATRTGASTMSTDIGAFVSDQYEGGIVHMWQLDAGPDIYLANSEVISNTATGGISVTITGTVDPSTDHIFITDDDVETLASAPDIDNPLATARIDPAEPDISLLSDPDYLPAACIMPMDVLGSSYNDDDVDFELHVDSETNTIEGCEGIRGGEDFWVVTIVGAYQGTPASSADGPFNSSSLNNYYGGISVPFWFAGGTSNSTGGCLSYIETNYDLSLYYSVNPTDVEQRTVAHEIGHLLGGNHDLSTLLGPEGGVMENCYPGAGAFSGASLRKFMLLRDKGAGH